jgi:cysteine desulfurase
MDICKMKHIYLDNAATTPVAKEVVDIVNEVNSKYFGNPSSIHSIGQEAKRIIDDGRRFVSFFVGCEPEEIIFTSGGSESDNLAIRGVIGNFQSSSKPHVITSAVEHHAVLHTIQDLEKEGKIEATYLKPDSKGIVSADSVKEAIRDNTILVSIIYVNNETGVVSPIREIGLEIAKTQKTRDKSGLGKIYFHTDAVQAAEFFEISPEYLKVDLLTFTAHKLHGPKGIGVLYAKKGVVLSPQITGGGQEFRRRAGTENISGIAGLSKALDLILKERSGTKNLIGNGVLPELKASAEAKRLIDLRDKIVSKIEKDIPEVVLNASRDRRAPHIVNISFINAEGEAIVLNLDFLGIAVSSGSACTSRSLEPSHVLSAMGVVPEKAHGSIRFSLSRYTTGEEIDKLLEVLPPIIEKLRAMSPIK